MTSRILVPVDLADIETTKKVLAAALDQAVSADAGLTVMTVVPAIVSGLDYRYAIRGETGGSAEYDVREIVNEAPERLNEIVSENTPDGMNVEPNVRHGPVYVTVLQVAEDRKSVGEEKTRAGQVQP